MQISCVDPWDFERIRKLHIRIRILFLKNKASSLINILMEATKGHFEKSLLYANVLLFCFIGKTQFLIFLNLTQSHEKIIFKGYYPYF